MAKVVKVRIWGFQSHVDTTYELDGGLNVFTGPSGAGKTSGTIRAFRWLAKGEPQGEDFLHAVQAPDGSKRIAEEAGVEVTLDNGVTVRKTRSKGKTRYYVEPLYSEPFEKAAVPEAVKQALGIDSTSFGDIEFDLNFAYQLAPPFLISEPGSAGAKVLGRLSGTEAVDGAIKSVSKDVYATRQDKADAERMHKKKSEQLADYQNLDELRETLDACDYLLEGIELDVERMRRIEGFAGALNKASVAIEEAGKALERFAVLPDIESDLQDVEKAQARYDRILDLYGQYDRANRQVRDLSNLLETYAGLEPAAYWLERTGEDFARRESLGRLCKEYHAAQEVVKKAQETLQKTAGWEAWIEALSSLEEAAARRDKLRTTLGAYLAASADVKRQADLLGKVGDVEQAAAIVKQAEADRERLAALQQVNARFLSLADSAARYGTQAEYAARELQEAENALKIAWDAAGGVCPLCEQAIEHNH